MSSGFDNNHMESSMCGMNFPTKLYIFLSLADEMNIAHIVSWRSHGRCFRVHDVTAFVNRTTPTWFKCKKYTSFQRQLNIYGFQRIVKGPHKNCYYHKAFLRGQPHLLQKIDRVPLKKNHPSCSLSQHEPDFDSMPALPESTNSSVQAALVRRQQDSVRSGNAIGRLEGLNFLQSSNLGFDLANRSNIASNLSSFVSKSFIGESDALIPSNNVLFAGQATNTSASTSDLELLLLQRLLDFKASASSGSLTNKETTSMFAPFATDPVTFNQQAGIQRSTNVLSPLVSAIYPSPTDLAAAMSIHIRTQEILSMPLCQLLNTIQGPRSSYNN